MKTARIIILILWILLGIANLCSPQISKISYGAIWFVYVASEIINLVSEKESNIDKTDV